MFERDRDWRIWANPGQFVFSPDEARLVSQSSIPLKLLEEFALNRSRMNFAGLLSSTLLAGLMGLSLPNQDATAQTSDAMSKASMAYPTGDKATSSLLVEVSSPGQMMVGKAYDYMITVTNLTKTVTLENVKVSQSTAEGFAVESSEPKADKSADGMAMWSIPKLDPGKSVTIKASGLGEKEGTVASCLKVDYESTLCVTTEFTKPAISVVKEAPKQVDICDPIQIKYVVKNTGTGTAKGLQVSDELPKGLTTTDGKQTFTTTVGDLAEGQSKEIMLNVNATQTGDFTSRAMAVAAPDLKAQSNQTTTAVRMAKLAVDIVGPESEYMDQRVTYQVTVKNDGEATARNATLMVNADKNSKVLRVSKVAPEAAAPKTDGNMLTWNLGNLEPGKSVVVSMTTTAATADKQTHVATATSVCAKATEDMKTVKDTIMTEVITLPALLLELVDKQDPMQVGSNEVYTIVVLNQGQGPDGNVKIVCRLPEGFDYVESAGPTKATVDGQTITFAPIETFAAKQKVTYTVTAKVTKPGDVRTKVDLSSDYLKTPVTETEPTRLIQ